MVTAATAVATSHTGPLPPGQEGGDNKLIMYLNTYSVYAVYYINYYFCEKHFNLRPRLAPSVRFHLFRGKENASPHATRALNARYGEFNEAFKSF